MIPPCDSLLSSFKMLHLARSQLCLQLVNINKIELLVDANETIEEPVIVENVPNVEGKISQPPLSVSPPQTMPSLVPPK